MFSSACARRRNRRSKASTSPSTARKPITSRCEVTENQSHGHAGHHHAGPGHTHGVSSDADGRYLTIAFLLIVGFMAFEIAVGILAHSLALLSDAAHMLTDAGALGLSLVVLWLAARPARRNLTFGLRRTEILSAQANGATLLVLAGLIVYGMIRRLISRPAPEGITLADIGNALAAYPGVTDVHDLHVWTITSGFPSLSAHVLVRSGDDCHAIRRELEQLLAERFHIDHTTLQVEHEPERLLSIRRSEASAPH